MRTDPVYAFSGFKQLCVVFGCTFMVLIFAVMANFGFKKGDVFMVGFCTLMVLISVFFITQHLPLIFNSAFLAVVPSGISLRHFGFIPWSDIEKIGVGNLGIFLLFRAAETVSVPFSFYRRVQRKDGKFLVNLRTEGVGLNAGAIEIILVLQVEYAAHLEPSRGYSVNTPVGEIDRTIANAKNGIKFLEKFEDVARDFKA